VVKHELRSEIKKKIDKWVHKLRLKEWHVRWIGFTILKNSSKEKNHSRVQTKRSTARCLII
jgi:hypothetical protein